MRTFTRVFSLLLVLLPSILFANVIVHGRVKYVNGTGVAGFQVRISGDSALANPGACYQNHTTYTNSTGFYSDTLVCNSNMSTVLVWIVNCNGTIIRQNYTLTPNQNVESNFTYCDSTVANQCHAFFGWQASNLEIRFNSSGSSTGTPAPDSIITRTWTFGDGTSLSGNVISPVHVYSQPGNYTVCLKIRTASGCESTVCNTVTISNITCAANFNWERIPGTNRVRFNSSTSSAPAPDSIISRKWIFGDGDSLSGNVVAPEHTYLPGTYSACLTIRTSRGCEKTTCKSVSVQSPNITCEASFTYQFLPNTATGFPVKFNSSASHTSPGDSIIVRRWTFGDGTSGLGIDPTHVYALPGVYTVCFRIETALNCGDSVCKTIAITPVQQRCEAVFFSDSIPTPVNASPNLFYIKFNSSASHGVSASDSVISRTWSFGDGTGISQGNTTIPVHGYAQAGTYTTCLYILTQSGCRDTVCKPVLIRPATTVNCQPRFTTTATALSVVFNSSTSSVNAGDSIIERKWTFGDGATAGNTVAVTHQYAVVGEYQICLTIRTRLGCVTTWCKKIAVINQPGNCVPYFTKEQVAAPIRTMRFNSTGAYSQFANDSIIERKWEFGDGQTLSGNIINPLHTYAHGGTYTVCLKIRTSHCDGRWCQNILVRPTDSTNQSDSIAIVNLYPVPVTTQLNAVVFSSHSNVAAELSIYDVYGVKKWAQNKILPQGNSTHNIPTSQLANGPYIFRVTTMYGIKSKNFFKLN